MGWSTSCPSPAVRAQGPRSTSKPLHIFLAPGRALFGRAAPRARCRSQWRARQWISARVGSRRAESRCSTYMTRSARVARVCVDSAAAATSYKANGNQRREIMLSSRQRAPMLGAPSARITGRLGATRRKLSNTRLTLMPACMCCACRHAREHEVHPLAPQRPSRRARLARTSSAQRFLCAEFADGFSRQALSLSLSHSLSRHHA